MRSAVTPAVFFNLSVMGPQIFTFVFQMTFSKVHIENPPYVMFLQN